ncbi:MAG: hypothetical protein GY702_10280, partial [Desulfobulbaceae bacterium]|nr:hypothetical protein [Desulfobulbaceae bacterium]
LAEVQRLQAQVAVLRKVHQLESDNSLNVKLGNVLIQGVDSPGNFIAVPSKVTKIWRESSRKTPPKTLGGKGFDKVIAVYSDGGFTAVEKMFSRVSPSPAIQANGYTALARHVMKSDRAAAADAARRAYEIDPQPFRLKWLAFRLHEAGDVIEAEAILDILSTEITFSESELRKTDRLRNEAKHVRQHNAKQKTGFQERRAEVDRQLASISREREEQASKIKELNIAREQEEDQNELLQDQLIKTQKELESLYTKYQTTEQAKEELEGQTNELAKLTEERLELIKQLTLNQTQKEEEKELVLQQLLKVQEEFEQQYLQCETLKQEKDELAREHQKQLVKLTQNKARAKEDLGRDIETMKQTLAKLEEKTQVVLQEKMPRVEAQIEQIKVFFCENNNFKIK